MDQADNKAIIDSEGFIYRTVKGPQTAKSMTDLMEQTDKLVEQMQKEGRPVKLLSDFAGVTKNDMGARLVGSKGLKRWDYVKAASFGESAALKTLLNLVIRASGVASRAHAFANEDQARNWLRKP